MQRVEIAADAIIDVARHVHEMAGTGDCTAQSVGVGLSTLGAVRGLDGMDVEVNCAGMIRIASQHALQCRHNWHALRIGFAAARLPVVPRAEIHDRLGIQRGNFVVIGKLRRNLGHFGRVSCV